MVYMMKQHINLLMDYMKRKYKYNCKYIILIMINFKFFFDLIYLCKLILLYKYKQLNLKNN